MILRLLGLLAASLATLSAAIPSPEAHFGFRMGDDRKLADWPSVTAYYRKVAAASDHVRLDELGKSTEGRPFLLVTVAAPSTLARLEDYRQIQKRLADPRKTTPAEAEQLAARGKTVVLLTCSIHSNEVASTLTAMEFLHRLLTEATPRRRAILDNVILLLAPSLNPDGVDKVASWYRRWLGTPYEAAPMVELYHKYTGHDNNRDWYMFTQQETRLAVEKIHNRWHPQIVYDVHQMGATGARIFVPPWVDPIDPNIDPLIVQQVNALGMNMAADLTAAGRKGVVVAGIYDYWTPGRHYQSYHNGLRILTESASVNYATPVQVPFSSLQTAARGYDAQRPSWNFLEPWPGGEWKLRDIVDDQLTAFESCLYNAALRREDLLRNFHRISRRTLARAAPAAFVIPGEQHDPNATTRLLETLEFGAVEIQRATGNFTAEGSSFREGDYVISMRQPFAPFAKTMLERQAYPDLREHPGGPPRRPYDVTAHSLPLLLGVEVRTLDTPVRAPLQTVEKIMPAPGRVDDAPAWRLSPARSNSFIAVNRLLEAGVEVYRNDRTGGDFHLRADAAIRPRIAAMADELGLHFEAAQPAFNGFRRLRRPRIGVYSGFVPIMDEGWTRWVLEKFEYAYSRTNNARILAGDLRADYDVIILPDAPPQTLHAGYIAGASYRGAKAPPAYTGGIENEGARALREFVEAGGSLLAFNEASQYAIERLGFNVENVLAGVGPRQFYAPGSLINADVNTSHPLGFGMRPREAVWFESGLAFRVPRDSASIRPVVTFPERDILASGWLLGQEYLANRAAVVEVSAGQGRAILFGIRPQYRGQPNATFKMIFNSLLAWR